MDDKSQSVKRYFKLLMNLPFLPANKIEETFYAIRNEYLPRIPNPADLTRFNLYWAEQWLGDVRPNVNSVFE